MKWIHKYASVIAGVFQSLDEIHSIFGFGGAKLARGSWHGMTPFAERQIGRRRECRTTW
jgi:hypothetical protein